MKNNDKVDARRRHLLCSGALLGTLPLASGSAGAANQTSPASPAMPVAPVGATPATLARDNAYWNAVAAQYDITDDVILLDNAYWGSMSKSVLADYQQQLAMVNRGNAWYGRVRFPAEFETARKRTADALGVHHDEIVFTRGATEALQVLIAGYQRLTAGDSVLYADIDYDNMITTMRWLKQRRGVNVVAISMPEPFSYDAVVAAYVAAMDQHPRLKLILLTHVNHRNGMVLPVAHIARLARERGIDVIVDTAHGFGQLDMRIPDLQADFVGINLHKWIGAPVGVGAVYIKRGRVRDIAPYLGEPDGDDISTRVHTGTLNFAAYLSLPKALDLHAADRRGEQTGAAAVFAQSLGRRRAPDQGRSCAGLVRCAAEQRHQRIPSERKTRAEDTTGLATQLALQHGIFTVPRNGLVSGSCIRVTPGIFTPESHIDALLAAMQKVAAA
jgi:selenocysteine lyase/cysteine desulfurase